MIFLIYSIVNTFIDFIQILFIAHNIRFYSGNHALRPGLLHQLHEALIFRSCAPYGQEIVGGIIIIFLFQGLFCFAEELVGHQSLLFGNAFHQGLHIPEGLVDCRFYRAGDNQRGTGLIDQNAVDLVHDGIEMSALAIILRTPAHVVMKIIESEFGVCAISYVAIILLAPFIDILAVLNDANCQSQIFIDLTHPFGVTTGQVIVDSDDMHTSSHQSIEIDRHGGNERLTLTGGHLCNLALVQDNSAKKLDIIRNHVPGYIHAARLPALPSQAAAGLPYHSEGFGQNRIEVFVNTLFEFFLALFTVPLEILSLLFEVLPDLSGFSFEFLGLFYQVFLRDILERGIDFIYLINNRIYLFQVPFMFRSEYFFNQSI